MYYWFTYCQRSCSNSLCNVYQRVTIQTKNPALIQPWSILGPAKTMCCSKVWPPLMIAKLVNVTPLFSCCLWYATNYSFQVCKLTLYICQSSQGLFRARDFSGRWNYGASEFAILSSMELGMIYRWGVKWVNVRNPVFIHTYAIHTHIVYWYIYNTYIYIYLLYLCMYFIYR